MALSSMPNGVPLAKDGQVLLSVPKALQSSKGKLLLLDVGRQVSRDHCRSTRLLYTMSNYYGSIIDYQRSASSKGWTSAAVCIYSAAVIKRQKACCLTLAAKSLETTVATLDCSVQ